MTTTKLYTLMAQALSAMAACEKTGNSDWFTEWGDRLDQMVELLPHGSGFDGTKLDRSTPRSPKLRVPYHHMDATGSYSGWSEHLLVVYPDLRFGFDLNVRCVDDDSYGFQSEEDEEQGSLVDETFMDFLHETFDSALRQDVIVTKDHDTERGVKYQVVDNSSLDKIIRDFKSQALTINVRRHREFWWSLNVNGHCIGIFDTYVEAEAEMNEYRRLHDGTKLQPQPNTKETK